VAGDHAFCVVAVAQLARQRGTRGAGSFDKLDEDQLDAIDIEVRRDAGLVTEPVERNLRRPQSPQVQRADKHRDQVECDLTNQRGDRVQMRERVDETLELSDRRELHGGLQPIHIEKQPQEAFRERADCQNKSKAESSNFFIVKLLWWIWSLLIERISKKEIKLERETISMDIQSTFENSDRFDNEISIVDRPGFESPFSYSQAFAAPKPNCYSPPLSPFWDPRDLVVQAECT
jgi:hypothetical protein